MSIMAKKELSNKEHKEKSFTYMYEKRKSIQH